MTSPSVELQTVLFNTLKADAGVMAIATDVYDNVPSSAVHPYITFGASDSNAEDAECIRIALHTFQIDVWSARKAQAECKNLAHAVQKALHNQSLFLTTHALIGIQASSVRMIPAPDQLSNHAVVTVTATIEEN